MPKKKAQIIRFLEGTDVELLRFFTEIIQDFESSFRVPECGSKFL